MSEIYASSTHPTDGRQANDRQMNGHQTDGRLGPLVDRIRSFVADRMADGTDIVILAGLMAIVSFSLLERQMGLDVIGLAKFAIRLAAVAWFGFLIAWRLVQTVSRERSLTSMLARGRWCSPILLPWSLFLFWSMLSLLWSPLKTISVGQWLGLAALLLMSQTIADRYRQSFLSRTATADYRELIVWLYVILAAYCAMVLSVHLVSPESSGFNREILRTGSQGFVHPTAAGATSSLTVLLGVLIFLFGWTRRRVMLLASLPIGGVVLLLSSSRAALGMLGVTLAIAAVFLVPRRLRGIVLVTTGVAMMGSIVAFPEATWMSDQIDTASDYFMRGQSVDQLKNVSGRSEMWAAVWHQFTTSPLVGHGYFVTSHNGLLDVWERISNHDAHHLILQVLVSTGLIGGVLFAWSLWRPTLHLARYFFHRRTAHREFLWCMVLFLVWFSGWAQTCVTFLGPIRPESVLFFALLGLVAAHKDACLDAIAGASPAMGDER